MHLSLAASFFSSDTVAEVPRGEIATTDAATVFDTPGWLAAWEDTTVDDVVARRYLSARRPDGSAVSVALYLVADSPFWRGYEQDAAVGPTWEGPVAYLPSLYAFRGAFTAGNVDLAPVLVDAARAQAQEWGAQALVVANLSRDIADRLAARLPPDLRIWLDASYELRLPPSSDGYFAGLRRDDRADLRRRWRRASERSVVFAEIEGGDLAARLPEFLELANASVVKHGIEPTYDLPTFEALARVPGARLLVAERGDEMLAGFYAFPANGCLTLWSGGIRYSALREFSPYVFLLYETVALSYRQGWRTIDFGRGNGGFKIRHGCTRQELWSSVYFAHEPQPEALRRLRTLHERLCRIDAAA